MSGSTESANDGFVLGSRDDIYVDYIIRPIISLLFHENCRPVDFEESTNQRSWMQRCCSVNQ